MLVHLVGDGDLKRAAAPGVSELGELFAEPTRPGKQIDDGYVSDLVRHAQLSHRRGRIGTAPCVALVRWLLHTNAAQQTENHLWTRESTRLPCEEEAGYLRTPPVNPRPP